jgi:hypothetical protein
MSLINDALKRAQEAQRKDSPAYIVSPMKPNAPAPAPARMPMPGRKQRNSSWFMPVVIILLLVVAVFFMAMAMAKRTVKTIVAAPAIPATQPVETAAASAPNPPAPVVTAAPEPPPEVIGPAAIKTDVPKPVIILQGVVNDPKHPWAIVNGKTVYLGDNVEGMRVTVISRSSITLSGNGQTNIVYVGQ